MKSQDVMFAGKAKRITFGSSVHVAPNRYSAGPDRYVAFSLAPVIDFGDQCTEEAARDLARQMDNKPLVVRGTRGDGKAIRWRFTRVRAQPQGTKIVVTAQENRRHTYGTCVVK